jgi:hypothetical protein
LSPAQGRRLFDRSAAVTHIESRRGAVFNHGIPPERVAAATRAEVRPVALRTVNNRQLSPGHAERLAANGRSLTVYRPPVATPGPIPRAAGWRSARRGTEPSPGDTARLTPSGPAHTQDRAFAPSADSYPSRSVPLILHGNAQVSGPGPTGSGRESAPPGSLIIIGRRGGPSQQRFGWPWAAAPNPPAWPGAPAARNAPSRRPNPSTPAEPPAPDRSSGLAMDESPAPQMPSPWRFSTPVPAPRFGNRSAAAAPTWARQRPSAPSYPMRPSDAQAPRYTPPPNPPPARSYSPPIPAPRSQPSAPPPPPPGARPGPPPGRMPR